MASKAELRKRLRADRMRLSAGEVQEKSARIISQLRRVAEWNRYQAVHCFETIESQNEVVTQDFIDFLLDERKIAVYTSRKLHGQWQTVAQRVADMTSVEPMYDAIIVPMLGFDDNLNRLGYGGGYYDRLLAAQPQAQKIGVCFELGRVAVLPAEAHDIPMDMIITEQRVYT